jgi:hypothetical protein
VPFVKGTVRATALSPTGDDSDAPAQYASNRCQSSDANSSLLLLLIADKKGFIAYRTGVSAD